MTFEEIIKSNTEPRVLTVLDWDTFADKFSSSNGYSITYRAQVPESYRVYLQAFVNKMLTMFPEYCDRYEIISIKQSGKQRVKFGARFIAKDGEVVYVYSTVWEPM